MEIYALGFLLFEGIGPKFFQKLLKKFKSSENAWKNLDLKSTKELKIQEKVFFRFEKYRKEFNPYNYIEKLKKAKVAFIPFENKLYPDRLKDLKAPPIGIFTKGNINLFKNKNNIGVVGTRKVTLYGKSVTELIVSDLVRNNIVITSGMALGVDATAHKTAVKNKGLTIAVLGCGVDCATPVENQNLYEEILDKNGLIISEYPLGMPPSKSSFPSRNRLIAALSLGVLITEAAEDSGSLITAKEALKLGKKVFAVPGPITSHMSRGSLKLLKQGAVLVSSANDIFENFKNLHVKKSNFKRNFRIKNLKLEKDEKKIIRLLENENLSLDRISKELKIPINKLLVMIANLELNGIVKNTNGEICLI